MAFSQARSRSISDCIDATAAGEADFEDDFATLIFGSELVDALLDLLAGVGAPT